jgi:Amt family ammonium transporter
VGAISVHGVCGLFGVLCVGTFADGAYGAGWNATGNAIAGSVSTGVTGALYGDWGQLGAQAIGALVLCTVMLGIVFAFFKIRDKLTKGGIRSTEADELEGLDVPEMGVPAYPEFISGDGELVRSGKDPSGEREYVGTAVGATVPAPTAAATMAPPADGAGAPPRPVIE